jgi:hypothetical protein
LETITISETNIVEYVEFLQRQKTISETIIVSDQRQKRQILETKTIIGDKKLYFLITVLKDNGNVYAPVINMNFKIARIKKWEKKLK